MGHTALETTFNELKHALLLQFFLAGHIIYDIGGLCRITPPNFANKLTIVQSDVRGGSNKPRRDQQRKHGARTPQCAFKSASPVEKLAHGAQLPPKPGLSHSTK